jgi:hypothetical protein
MSPHLPSPTDAERTALLRLEAAYEQWRLAETAVMEQEVRLWTEKLRGADDETLGKLGAETLSLRAAARTAREALLALLKVHGA